MPTRSLILLGLGLLIAVGTALSLHNRMNKAATVARTQVIVAATTIPAGTFVRSDAQLALVDWPADNITSVMLTTATTQPAKYNGAVARRTITAGEPIQENMLVRSNEGGFMSAVLDPGKRAVSIAVDPTTGNAGFIFPGDHVDLILTHIINRANAAPSRASETFIADARVLAVDQSLDNPENKAVLAKTVTLEVTPKQAEEINLAKDLGKISLSLRSLANGGQKPVPEPIAAAEKDAKEVHHAAESLDDVLRENIAAEAARQPAPSAAPAAIENVTRDTDVSKVITPENSEGRRVQLIRGNERSEIMFGPSSEAPRGPQ